MPETSPAITPRCPSCGSDAIVPDVVVYAAGHGIHALHIGVITRPDAMVKKGIVSSPARYRACSDCGLVMQFADDPHALWEGHVERTSRTLDS